jgi:hydrogenase small subunit
MVPLTVAGTEFKPKPSRRTMLTLLTALAGVLMLPDELVAAFTGSLAKTPKLPVIWLSFQDCTGDSESLLRSGERADPLQSGVTDPGIVDLLLSVISLEYHETLMAPSGKAAEKSLNDCMTRYRGKYVAVVEGAIPTALNGACCMIGGKSAVSIAQTVCSGAMATIAAGSCGVTGCLPGAKPNPTGAKGVLEAFPSLPNVMNMPGCPLNAVNLTAALCYVIAYGALPPLDSSRRPVFAYGRTVHSRCPRRERAEDGPWARAWGDAAHRSAGCLIKMGCKGPVARANCPSVQWNGGVCWPVASGHGCIACVEPKFWDNWFPYYSKILTADD